MFESRTNNASRRSSIARTAAHRRINNARTIVSDTGSSSVDEGSPDEELELGSEDINPSSTSSPIFPSASTIANAAAGEGAPPPGAELLAAIVALADSSLPWFLLYGLESRRKGEGKGKRGWVDECRALKKGGKEGGLSCPILRVRAYYLLLPKLYSSTFPLLSSLLLFL